MPEEFVIYALGCLMLPFLFSFEVSVNKVLIMDMSRSLSLNDYTESKKLFFSAVTELFKILWPACLGLIAYSEQIISTLYTETYLGSAPVLSVFAITYLLMVIPFNAVARAQERTSFVMKIYATSAFIGVLLTVILVESLNYWGALIAVIMAQVTLRALGFFDTLRTLNLKSEDFSSLKSLLFPFLSGLLFVLVPGLIISHFGLEKNHELIGFFVFGFLGALLYLYSNYHLRKNR